jgi:selenocysteine-specific elongation factor
MGSVTRVVATAGHVDHGKSSLVRALTGTDPDRFAEEKARGLTIDLGYAHTALPSGTVVSFVDVPGHVRFVRNMLAGVGGVDACLFVVAATEGWKPQSEEHLRILELVGVRHGIVALTKIDVLDDPDLVELAAADVAERVAGTFLDGADIVPVAAPAGTGLDELRIALERLVGTTPGAFDHGRPRLWVDRVFAARGSGTVVTGTLTGGGLRAGAQLEVVAHRLDAPLPVRVRAVQRHGADIDDVGPGNRVALNLVGVERRELVRGDAVVESGRWHRCTVADASFTVLASLGHRVSRRGAWTLHIGSGDLPVTVRVLGPETLAPGETGLVRLRLGDHGIPLLPGDRYVLRESGRGETVGGGEILDIDPLLPAARARPDRDPWRVVAEREWVRTADLEMLTGVSLPATLGDWVSTVAALDALVTDLRVRLDGADALGLDVAALDERSRLVLDRLVADGSVKVTDGRALPVEAADPLADHPFVASLRAGGTSPPEPGEIPRAEIRELVRRGFVVERDGICFHPDAIASAAHAAAALLAREPSGFTMAEFRDALGTTRKFALPLAAELDARGVTRRRDDVRIGGPRLPDARHPESHS